MEQINDIDNRNTYQSIQNHVHFESIITLLLLLGFWCKIG